MIDRLLEMVSTTNDHALYRQMDMVNDTLISGGIKYFDELKSDLEIQNILKTMQILPISNSYYQLSTKIWVMNQKARNIGIKPQKTVKELYMNL